MERGHNGFPGLRLFFFLRIFLHPSLVGATKLEQLFTINVYRVFITTDIPVNRMVENSWRAGGERREICL